MKKYITFLLTLVLLSCHTEHPYVNVPALSDNDPSTVFTGREGTNRILFKGCFTTPIQNYTIYSAGDDPRYDPAGWILKGSYDGKTWITLDKQDRRSFCSRYQEILCRVHTPSNYSQYLLEVWTATQDTLKIGEIGFSQENLAGGWEEFVFPEVDFINTDRQAEGSRLYATLVQNPETYIQYHAQKVAAILYTSARDSMPRIQKIHYTLCDYDGISRKTGNPPEISIDYSTRHIEKIGRHSLYALDRETRGILYHVLSFAYQYEPRGIGTYETSREFKACVEGLAFAVRAQTGWFNPGVRTPGGHWLDGQQTTGFFLHWLTSKNPETVRRFNQTIKDLETWSFDAAIKQIFGTHASVENYWNEYQMDINRRQLKELV